MFAGFNLSIDKDFWKNEDEFNKYKNIGERHLNCNKKDLQFELEKYTIDNVINGHKIQEDWFPQIDADVFCRILVKIQIWLTHWQAGLMKSSI